VVAEHAPDTVDSSWMLIITKVLPLNATKPPDPCAARQGTTTIQGVCRNCQLGARSLDHEGMGMGRGRAAHLFANDLFSRLELDEHVLLAGDVNALGLQVTGIGKAREKRLRLLLRDLERDGGNREGKPHVSNTGAWRRAPHAHPRR